MILASVLLLYVLPLVIVADKCDKYVVGNVWIHKSGAGDEEGGQFQGCKKGCFWNGTYNEDGVRVCGKCSDIKDEIECTNNEATCLWNKGKCTSQSCPQIAKTRNTGAFITNNTAAAVSKGRPRLLKECIEGSALEQEYNNRDFDNYKKNINLESFQNNCPSQIDTCVNPCSFQYNPSATNATDNAAVCNRRFGCVYVPGNLIPDPADTTGTAPWIADPQNDRCIYPCTGYTVNTTIDIVNPNIAGCTKLGNVATPCRHVPGANQWNDRCEAVTAGPNCTPFTPGTNNGQHCQRLGCYYNGSDRGDGTFLSASDTCTARQNYGNTGGTCMGFKAGDAVNGTQAKCEDLGCTFTPVNPIPTGGGDRVLVGCGSFQTTCVGSTPPSVPCSYNRSLGLNQYLVNGEVISPAKVCDDRLYPSGTLGTVTTCRALFDVVRQKCIFDFDELLDQTVHVSGVVNAEVAGDIKPATKYQACMETQGIVKDPFLTQDVLNTTTNRLEAKPVGITEANRKNLYGFSTPKEYCDHYREVELKKCQNAYDTSLNNSCYATSANVDFVLPITQLQRNHAQTKAARSACHEIYGCMYSRSNERCSMWSVWAFILTIVIVVVAVVGVGAVVGVFALLKNK